MYYFLHLTPKSLITIQRGLVHRKELFHLDSFYQQMLLKDTKGFPEKQAAFFFGEDARREVLLLFGQTRTHTEQMHSLTNP